MKENGQQQKPLIISEYGTVFGQHYENGICRDIRDEYGECFTYERVSKFLSESFYYFDKAKDPNLGYALDENRMAQQVFWFSSHHPNQGSNLLAKNWKFELSPTGEAFRDFVEAEGKTVNLLVEDVAATIIESDSSGLATAQLSMRFRNNGNHAVNQPFSVTFYKDSGLSQPIGTTQVSPTIIGCATRSYTASVEWADLVPGVHSFWVKLDSGNVIQESPPGKSDNSGSSAFATGGVNAYTVDVQIVGEGDQDGGVVSIEPNSPAYTEGQIVSLTAVPQFGWRFAGWSGDESGVASTINLTMDSNKRVQANFARSYYAVNTSVSGGGSIQITPAKSKYSHGEWVTVAAIANQDWRFDHWSGSVSAAGASFYLNVTKNEEIRAHFAYLLPGVSDEIRFPIIAAP
jgi:hypothetical protein